MSTQKRTKKEETIRALVSTHYSEETGKTTHHYEDVPIGVYKEWWEGVVDGLARSYYGESSFLLLGVKKNEINGQ